MIHPFHPGRLSTLVSKGLPPSYDHEKGPTTTTSSNCFNVRILGPPRDKPGKTWGKPETGIIIITIQVIARPINHLINPMKSLINPYKTLIIIL